MERVTARQVLHHLTDSNFPFVCTEDDGSTSSREFDTAHRAVRRNLNTNVFPWTSQRRVLCSLRANCLVEQIFTNFSQEPEEAGKLKTTRSVS